LDVQIEKNEMCGAIAGIEERIGAYRVLVEKRE